MLAVVTVTTDQDVVDVSDGVTSLREAIFATNLVSGADEIRFDFGHDGPATILLIQGELQITDDLTITGPGADLLAIDASGSDPTPDQNDGEGTRIFLVDDEIAENFIEVTFDGMTLTGADEGSLGTAIRSFENVNIFDAAIVENSIVSQVGAVIDSIDGHLEIRSTVVTNNYGAAIRVVDGSLGISDSTITNNTLYSAGIRIEGSQAEIHDITFSANEKNPLSPLAPLSLLARDGATLTLTGSTFSNNPGGLFLQNSGAYVSDSVIQDNATTGLQVYNNLGQSITVENCVISGNTSGLHLTAIAITVRDTIVSQNMGVGVYMLTAGGGSALLERCTVSGNIGDRGGGVYAASLTGEALIIRDSLVEANESHVGFGFDPGNGAGGGVYLARGNLLIENSVIRNNTSDFHGGGIYLEQGSATILDSSIIGNSATYEGGGLWADGAGMTIRSSTIADNTANDGGGIWYSSTFFTPAVTITDCVISGNVASRDGGGVYADAYPPTDTLLRTAILGNSAGRDGGGVYAITLAITDSTIAGNTADAGGGVWLWSGGIDQTTVSGNKAVVGGGLFVRTGFTAITLSTVAFNEATNLGGGIFVASASPVLRSVILARNSAPIGRDLTGLIGTSFDVTYSLIGLNSGSGLTMTPPGMVDENGNMIGGSGNIIDPLLGPLAYNGGPTKTHALLAGSPAISAGDPDAVAGENDIPLYDQRGAPYTRVYDERLDIGAFESQPPVLPGDYNLDGKVGAGDYPVWRNALGLTGVVPYSGADGDGDGEITKDDYQLWKDSYGNTLPLPGAGAAVEGLAVAEPAMAPSAAPVSIAVKAAPVVVEEQSGAVVGALRDESVVEVGARDQTLFRSLREPVDSSRPLRAARPSMRPVVIVDLPSRDRALVAMSAPRSRGIVSAVGGESDGVAERTQVIQPLYEWSEKAGQNFDRTKMVRLSDSDMLRRMDSTHDDGSPFEAIDRIFEMLAAD